MPVKYIDGSEMFQRTSVNKIAIYDYCKGVKNPPVLYVFITGVLKDTGVSWMGFHNQQVYGWLRDVLMYLGFKYQLSRVTIKVSRTLMPFMILLMGL